MKDVIVVAVTTFNLKRRRGILKFFLRYSIYLKLHSRHNFLKRRLFVVPRLIFGIPKLFLYWNSKINLALLLLSTKTEYTNGTGSLSLCPQYLGFSKEKMLCICNWLDFHDWALRWWLES